LDSQELFEEYFKLNQQHSYSLSVLSFFEEVVRSRLPQNGISVLDIGCGNYSLFEDVKDLKADISAIDFSKMAISQAPHSKIKYIEGNVISSLFFKDSFYDLIVDSHCLNCILEESDRLQVLKNIYNALKMDGLFASELMVQPIDRTVAMPYKKIKTMLEIENDLNSFGFKIQYFQAMTNYSFVNEGDGSEIKCDLLRLIASK